MNTFKYVYIYILSREIWKIIPRKYCQKKDIPFNSNLFLIVENLQNTNIKTKKIKLTHNPFTQKIPVSIYYKNPSNIFPQYMQ